MKDSAFQFKRFYIELLEIRDGMISDSFYSKCWRKKILRLLALYIDSYEHLTPFHRRFVFRRSFCLTFSMNEFFRWHLNNSRGRLISYLQHQQKKKQDRNYCWHRVYQLVRLISHSCIMSATVCYNKQQRYRLYLDEK